MKRSRMTAVASWALVLVAAAVFSISFRAPSLPQPEPLSAQLQASGTGTFTISGDVNDLAPGVGRPVVLTMTNPSAFYIEVTAVSVAVSDTADCPIIFASTYAGGLIVPPNGPATGPVGSLTLSAAATDVCQGQSFALTYTGTAIKAQDIAVAHVDLHGDIDADSLHRDVDVRICNTGDVDQSINPGDVALGVKINGLSTGGSVVLKDPDKAQTLKRKECKDWHLRWDAAPGETAVGNSISATGIVTTDAGDRVPSNNAASATQTAIKPRPGTSYTDASIARVDPHGDIVAADVGHNDVDVKVCDLGKTNLTINPSAVSLSVNVDGTATAGTVTRKDPTKAVILKPGDCPMWHFRWDYAPNELGAGRTVAFTGTVSLSDAKPANNAAGVTQTVVKL